MAGITQMQVKVEEMIPSRASAMCSEVSTGKQLEIGLLPMRGRVPAVGERWLLDRTFGAWSFAALLTSPTLFAPRLSAGEDPPANPQVGDRWVPTPAKVWDGSAWVDE